MGPHLRSRLQQFLEPKGLVMCIDERAKFSARPSPESSSSPPRTPCILRICLVNPVLTALVFRLESLVTTSLLKDLRFGAFTL